MGGIRTHHSSVTTAINSLTHTNEKLKIITNVRLNELKDDIVKTLDIQKEAIAEGLETGFGDLSKQLLTLAEQGQRTAQQQIILQTLVFEQMEQREEAIKDAHKATLDWMFEENETHFMQWLKAGKSIYWVKGKVRGPG